jgi:TatD DNase family protein
MYDGVYSGSRKHDADRDQVLARAWQMGIQRIILTVGTIFECEPAFKIAANDGEFYLEHFRLSNNFFFSSID